MRIFLMVNDGSIAHTHMVDTLTLSLKFRFQFGHGRIIAMVLATVTSDFLNGTQFRRIYPLSFLVGRR